MLNIDLRRYGTDKDYEQFINGYLKGADIGDNPSERQFVCIAREVTDEEVKGMLGKKKEMTIDFKPCPFCGHTDIGVKDNIVDALMGHDKPSACRRKIWAYCRYCEATSGHTIRDIVYDDEEIIIAMELWNRRVEAIPKADYEARLKAEVAERLEKFQKKIEELDLTDVFPDYQRGATDTRDYISNMLQEEIDSLKGENEKA